MDKYTIDLDRTHNLIRYRIEGFWTVATVDAFGQALADAIAQAGGAGKLRLLGDATAFVVQSGEVAHAFEKLMLSVIVPRVGRVAVVVAKMLNKLQVERGTGASDVHVFLNEEDAVAWLNEPGA